MKILYIENHEVFASTVTRLFLAAHQVVVVPSLSAARQALAATSYDLALVDYDLDDGKGDEIVREIVVSQRSVVIIGVSSHDKGNEALLKAGASAICDKGHFDQIQNVIEATCRNRHV